jgi:hypothetical protein
MPEFYIPIHYLFYGGLFRFSWVVGPLHGSIPLLLADLDVQRGISFAEAVGFEFGHRQSLLKGFLNFSFGLLCEDNDLVADDIFRLF